MVLDDLPYHAEAEAGAGATEIDSVEGLEDAIR